MAVFFGQSALALQLDWDTSNPTLWTNGGVSTDPAQGATATQNFETDAGNTGNDVTVAVLNNSGATANWFTPGISIVNTPLTGGTSPAQKALMLQLDNQNATTNYIQVTITFNYTVGVNNVNFNIWDIDKTVTASTTQSFQDRVGNITATLASGGTINPVSVTTSTDNTYDSVNNWITGIGTTDPGGPPTAGNEDDALSSANATINFGSNIITSLTFRYYNLDLSATAGQQRIAIADINYDKAPEVHPGLMAVLLCGLMIAWKTYRKNRKPSLAL